MADKKTKEEAAKLLALLSSEGLESTVLEARFPDYSDAAKAEVAARVATTYSPAPPGRLLARLLFIRPAAPDAALRQAFLASLNAPDPAARKFALNGLKIVGHPALADLALAALRDTSDAVLATAVEILAPVAKKDPPLASLLLGFYVAHKGKDEFHMSVSLLEAHGLVKPPPKDE